MESDARVVQIAREQTSAGAFRYDIALQRLTRSMMPYRLQMVPPCLLNIVRLTEDKQGTCPGKASFVHILLITYIVRKDSSRGTVARTVVAPYKENARQKRQAKSTPKLCVTVHPPTS